MPSDSVSPTPLRHLIVGSGITGLLTAQAFEDMGIPCIIYERAGLVAGLWNPAHPTAHLANKESTIESDPVCYGFANEACSIHANDDPFLNYHITRDEILARLEGYAKDLQTPIVFRRDVLRFTVMDGGAKVAVTSRDMDHGTEVTEEFAGLHICTGSLTKQLAQKEMYQGQALFQGRVLSGFGDDISLEELKGKRVVIVGCGSFALENVKRALMAEAASIVLIVRRPRFHMFDLASYELVSRLSTPQALDPTRVTHAWARMFEVNRVFAEATGTTSVLMHEETMRVVQGQSHMVLRDGFFCPTADALALGVYYGLVDYRVDKVDHFTSDGLVCESGLELQCDVVLQCFGFESEAAQSLLKGHTIRDSLWVDALPTVTSTAGLGKVRGHQVIGPNSPGATVLFLTYYAFHTFGQLIATFLKDRELFQQFLDFAPFSALTDAEYPHYMCAVNLPLFNQ